MGANSVPAVTGRRAHMPQGGGTSYRQHAARLWWTGGGRIVHVFTRFDSHEIRGMKCIALPRLLQHAERMSPWVDAADGAETALVARGSRALAIGVHRGVPGKDAAAHFAQ